MILEIFNLKTREREFFLFCNEANLRAERFYMMQHHNPHDIDKNRQGWKLWTPDFQTLLAQDKRSCKV